jgi:hypothetical protein
MSDEITLRDTFAAAALTGLQAAPTDKDRSLQYWARLSYETADAMLRERERVEEAADEIQRLQNRSLEGREMERQEPVAWAICHKDHQYVSLLREHAEAHNVYADAEVVPLYRQPQPALTDEEREAIKVCESVYSDNDMDAECWRIAATLRALLKRLA